MKFYPAYKISLLVIFSWVAFSCSTTQHVSSPKRMNLSFLYNPSVQNIHAQVVAHNVNSNTTRVYCQIPSKDLIFIDNGENTSCNLNIRYTIYNTTKGLKLVDTMSFIQTLVNENKENYLFSFDINLNDSNDYMLDLFISEPTLSTFYHQYITIEKKQKINANDFLILNKKGLPYFEPWLCDTDTFSIVLKKNLPKEWKFAWYPNNFKLCMPPYQMTTNKDFILPEPDSMRYQLICDSCYFTLTNKAILHIYLDSVGNGKTLFNFSCEYPNFVRPSELLAPLRMLNSQREFNELNILADKKEAIDRFWLGTSGNISRARELIRVFYTRVMLANKFFTSYTEGWKTDRGIIYIIFGLPTTIYKAPNIEQWIYGTLQSPKVLVFNFYKKENPFSNNHYVLERNENYKISWLQAVDTWRNGRVFSIAYE